MAWRQVFACVLGFNKYALEGRRLYHICWCKKGQLTRRMGWWNWGLAGAFQRTMHEWVDQFATQPKSLFTQNFGQNLEITSSLYWFLSFFSMSLMEHLKFLFV